MTQFDPNGHVAIQVAATLFGVGVGIYNAMQNPCWSMKSLATAAVIGGAVGFASTFGAGPLSAAFFGGGSAAAGSALEQSILGEVDWGTVGTAAAWGGSRFCRKCCRSSDSSKSYSRLWHYWVVGYAESTWENTAYVRAGSRTYSK